MLWYNNVQLSHPDTNIITNCFVSLTNHCLFDTYFPVSVDDKIVKIDKWGIDKELEQFQNDLTLINNLIVFECKTEDYNLVIILDKMYRFYKFDIMYIYASYDIHQYGMYANGIHEQYNNIKNCPETLKQFCSTHNPE